MGTSKSGSYLNTKGAAYTVSDFTAVHANEGAFRRLQSGELILVSGSHGEDGLALLKKYGIEHHITKTYPNGVRLGYIPRHEQKYKRVDGKTVNKRGFPRIGICRIYEQRATM